MDKISKIIDEAWRTQDTGIIYEDLDNRKEYITREQWEDAARWAIAEALSAYEDAMLDVNEDLETLMENSRAAIYGH